ncbi:hypothetical protein [Pseudomonas sp. NMS19W]|uniref:hypothetical protein n=1 Tax=Pseudomonas sp. NMS19W TaxID=3079768 RepID=UPI003F659A2A
MDISKLLDRTFAFNGVATLMDLPDTIDSDRHIKDIKVTTNDKIVVSAQFAIELIGLRGLTRLTADGQIDRTFGVDGLAANSIPSSEYVAAGKIALQPDGSIVMLVGLYPHGASGLILGVERYDSEGILDQQFGDNGLVILDDSPVGELEIDLCQVSVQADGQILVCATYWDSFEVSSCYITRLTSTGQLDKTFNGSGRVKVENRAYVSTQIHTLQNADDNSCLVAGGAQMLGIQCGFVAKYNGKGKLDYSFGTPGTAGFTDITIQNHQVVIHEVLTKANGKLVAVGIATTNDLGKRFGLMVGLNADGTTDHEFNGGLPLLTSIDRTHGNEWVCAHLQDDGKIVVSGGSKRLYIARFHEQGVLDTTFGSKGFIELDTYLVTRPASMQVQKKGRTLISGNALGLGVGYGQVFACSV